MLSKRKKPVNDHLRMYSILSLALDQFETPLEPKELEALTIVNEIQKETNSLPELKLCALRMQVSAAYFSNYMVPCVGNGFIDRNNSILNVTVAGEYHLRGFAIILSRLINETKLSKWKKVKRGDSMEVLYRKPGGKGIKLKDRGKV